MLQHRLYLAVVLMSCLLWDNPQLSLSVIFDTSSVFLSFLDCDTFKILQTVYFVEQIPQSEFVWYLLSSLRLHIFDLIQAMFLIHSKFIRWHTISFCPSDVNVSHLVKVVAARLFHCEYLLKLISIWEGIWSYLNIPYLILYCILIKYLIFVFNLHLYGTHRFLIYSMDCG